MSDWNTKIIEEFRANEGRVGGPFEGAPMILLHHIGAKSRHRARDAAGLLPAARRPMVVVASKAGAPTNPDWYHNLKANPGIDVEVGTETFPVTAAEVVGAERERSGRRRRRRPGFGEYQEKTTPDPGAAPGPPAEQPGQRSPHQLPLLLPFVAFDVGPRAGLLPRWHQLPVYLGFSVVMLRWRRRH